MPTGNRTTASKAQATEAWAETLREFVTEKGEVNFKRLQKDPSPLLTYINYLQKITPQQFPNRAERLAHYLNAYNALAMYNVLEYGVPDSLGGFNKIRLLFSRKLEVGGEIISLKDYLNQYIRPENEPRVHFALSRMSDGCPHLKDTPYTAASLEDDLNSQAWRFFNDERFVAIDHTEKIVLLSDILDFYSEDFLKNAPSLLAYANQFRSAKKALPLTYRLEFIEYNWKTKQVLPPGCCE